MMTYFEVRDRLKCLQRFRNLYAEYIDFTNRPNNVPAQMVLQKMEPMETMVVESVKKVGLGHLITREAPVHGGKRVRVNLIKAIFRDTVIRRFSVKDKEPLEMRPGEPSPLMGEARPGITRIETDGEPVGARLEVEMNDLVAPQVNAWPRGFAGIRAVREEGLFPVHHPVLLVMNLE